jgi:predicted metal-dependent hydrolase
VFKNGISLKYRTIIIEPIGPAVLHKSNQARRLSIRISPFKGILIVIPRGVTFGQAEEFARARVDWIARHYRRIKQMEQQSLLKDNLPPIDRQEAGRILMARLDELSKRYGFHYQKVTIRNQTTRWGSCSARNNINLNLKLIRLPAALIDYVLLHELVHTRIKNHSAKFWKELSGFIPAPKVLSKQLRKCGAELI